MLARCRAKSTTAGMYPSHPRPGTDLFNWIGTRVLYHLDVGHGIVPDQRSRNPTRCFPTLDKLHEAIGKQREKALSQGFKRYTLLYVQGEGKPLKSEADR
jgi:hypothetical protein